MEAALRYHLSDNPEPITYLSFLEPRRIETLFRGQHPGCYLPSDMSQSLVLSRDPTKSPRLPNTVFDGQFPDANVVRIKRAGDGGTIVLLTRHLFPPSAFPSAIAQDTAITAFLDALKVGDGAKVDYKRTDNGMTMFVPLISGESDLMPLDVGRAASFAAAHTTDSVIFSGDFPDPEEAPVQSLADGYTLAIYQAPDGGYTVNGKRIIMYDVPTSFGVVHVLEEPLFDPRKKLGVASENKVDGETLPPPPDIPITQNSGHAKPAPKLKDEAKTKVNPIVVVEGTSTAADSGSSWMPVIGIGVVVAVVCGIALVAWRSSQAKSGDIPVTVQ